MTREEAIEILKDLWRYEHSTYLETDIRKALEMAIKALEQEPCRDMEEIKEIHCNCTDAEIAKSFIKDVEAVKDLLLSAGMTGDRNCKECNHTEDECKDCYPELGYRNNKLKRDTEAVEKFVESDYFKKLMKSLDKMDESFKTDEWRERLHRALFTREEWEKVMKDMDEIYEIERKARKKAYIRKKVLEDRNMEFIMPEATMYVDPISDESIHTIDFAHGYDYCKNAMKKEIHKLEDAMNGTVGEFTRGWNLALKKVLEVMESEVSDEKGQRKRS